MAMARPALGALLAPLALVTPEVTSCSSAKAPPAAVGDVNIVVDLGGATPAAHLLAKGAGFGAVDWYPPASGEIEASELFAPAHKLSVLRLSLQRFATPAGLTRDVFTAAVGPAVKGMPDKALIHSFIDGGGLVLFDFMGVPEWLRNTSSFHRIEGASRKLDHSRLRRSPLPAG